jgi:hydrogenase maturation protease
MSQNNARQGIVGVDWRRSLSRHLHGRGVLVALGDRTAGDDAAGPCLIDKLRGKTDLVLIDAGTYPQNYFGVIARANPDSVIFIDGAELELLPGDIRFLGMGDVTDLGGGSHGFPLTVLFEQTELLAGADVFLLGVQVASLARGTALSKPVAEAIADIARFVVTVRPCTLGQEES